MTIRLRIEPATALHPAIETLRVEAADEGFGFIERLILDWEAGTNRFNRLGERFLGAWLGPWLVAIGGLNHDPYVEGGNTARIRHLYVKKSERRCGVGSALLQRLLHEASDFFHIVRLRTDTPEAAAFYVRNGFLPITDHSATHAKFLRQ